MTTNALAQQRAVEGVAHRFMEAVAENRGWFIGLGALTIIAGFIALAFPFASSVAVEIIVGATFAAVGILQLFHAFSTRSWSGFFLDLFVALIYGAAGFFLLARPVEGTAALTIVVAATFFASGLVNTIWSFQMERHSGWGWVLASGIVSMLLGGILMANFPITAMWTLGVLAGINFLASGTSMLALGIAAGDVAQDVAKNIDSHTHANTNAA